jgi:hypothetical protein
VTSRLTAPSVERGPTTIRGDEPRRPAGADRVRRRDPRRAGARRRARLGRLAGVPRVPAVTASEARTAAATAQAARLEHARARLEESVATATVLAGAAGEIWSFLQGIRSVVPEK